MKRTCPFLTDSSSVYSVLLPWFGRGVLSGVPSPRELGGVPTSSFTGAVRCFPPTLTCLPGEIGIPSSAGLREGEVGGAAQLYYVHSWHLRPCGWQPGTSVYHSDLLQSYDEPSCHHPSDRDLCDGSPRAWPL